MSAREPAAPQPEGAAPRRRFPWLTLVKLAVAAGLVGLIVYKGQLDGDDLRRALSSPASIVTALVLGGVGISMSGVRWAILLRGEGIDVSLGHALHLTWIGHFFNMVFPGAVSGDAVKMYYVGRHAPDRREEAWTTVLADRVIGLMALVSLSAVGSLLTLRFTWSRPELRAAFLTMVGILVVFVGIGAALALGAGTGSPRLRRAVSRLPFLTTLARGYRVLVRLGRQPGRVALSFLISFVAHGLAVANAFVLGRAAGEDVLSWLSYATLFPVAMFSNAVPISPGGLGVGETVLGKLFVWSGASLEHGVAVMILFRAMFLTLALLGAILYLAYRRGDTSSAGEGSP